MRHRNYGRKLSRNTEHRRALLRNLVTSLILEERIETTVAKAKAERGIAEQMITLGRRGDLHARRQALSVLRSIADELDLVTRDDYEELELRVAQLEHRLRLVEGVDASHPRPE